MRLILHDHAKADFRHAGAFRLRGGDRECRAASHGTLAVLMPSLVAGCPAVLLLLVGRSQRVLLVAGARPDSHVVACLIDPAGAAGGSSVLVQGTYQAPVLEVREQHLAAV